MGFIGVFILLIIIALIAYVAVTGGSQLCGLPVINLFCKCAANDPTISGGDPDGKCWKCPKVNGSQMKRTDDPVTTNTACVGDCTKMYPGGFEDGTSAECWSCPKNYSIRTGDAITLPTACKCSNGDCAKRYPGNYGDVVSDLTLNQCWACPPGKVRTIYAVNGSGLYPACGDPGGVFDTKVPAKLLGTAFASATHNGPMRAPAAISSMRLF